MPESTIERMGWFVRRGALAPLVLLFVAGAGACSSNTAIYVASGSVIVDWTVLEAKIPSDCTTSGATTLHVTLTNSGGSAEYVQDCTAFATTISGLVPDTYAGAVQLLDAVGAPRTTSVVLQPFDVFAGQTSTIAVDFPADSFN